MENKQVETSDSKPLRDEKGRLLPGNTANPDGRKPETPEQKAIKRATKELIMGYKEMLAEALPQISPVLIDLAINGNLQAIKEINDRVMGMPRQSLDLGVDDDIKSFKVEIVNARPSNNKSELGSGGEQKQQSQDNTERGEQQEH